MKEWLARHGGWLLLAVLVAIYYPLFGKGLDSIELYAQAGQCVHRDQVMLQCLPLFSYQPALAFLMIPFVFIPVGLHKLVWYIICVGSLVIVVRISEALAERLYPGVTRGRSLIWLRGISLFLCSKHIMDVLNYQAYEAPALALMMIGIWGLVFGREALGGLSLSVAAAVRATPLIFLPYLIVKRRTLACAVFVTGFIVVSLLPDALALLHGGRAHFVTDWIHQIAAPAITPGQPSDLPFWTAWTGNNLNNQSLRGLVNRFVTGPVYGLSPTMILLMIYAVFGLVLAALLLKPSRDKAYAAIDGCILLIANVALSPMTSRYHFVFVLPAFVLVVAAVINDPRMRVLGSIVVAVSFVLLTGTSNDITGQALSHIAYLYGYMIEGAILLFVAFAAMLYVWPPPGIATRDHNKI